MKKYISLYKISFQQEFIYRLNFIMWRIRNVLHILLVFFLWDTVFLNPNRITFGYDRTKMLTYVFGLLIIRAFVLSSRAVDVAGEISSGDFINYLTKPISYFKYWMTRDLSSKSLNLIFAVLEFIVLFLILNPPFYIQTNVITLLLFLFSVILAILIFFTILFIVSSVTFWMPEAGWGAQFLITVVMVEFLSGALFPLDILPKIFQTVLSYTPFPYLIFFPLEIYLGKVVGLTLIKGFAISLFWVLLLLFSLKIIWEKGLKAYQAYGR